MSKLSLLKQKVDKFKSQVTQKLGEVDRELEDANRILENITGDDPQPKPKKRAPDSGPCNLKESAPLGSFDRVEEDIRACLSNDKKALFPDMKEYDSPWMMYAFPEKIIVSLGNKYYEISYVMDMNGVCTFGKPVEVEQMYTPAMPSVSESARKKPVSGKPLSAELKESGIEITKPAEQMDFDLADFASLSEAKYDASTGEVEIVVIEAGTNKLKRRHYPDSTIRECAANFAGLKMYINHPTRQQEAERPERDLRDWASTIVESWYEDGKAMAKVAVHDDWLRERLSDPVARQHMGVSINTGGKISVGKVNGEEMQIVEKIILARSNGPASVDWVTEAGARGRVSRLLKESQSTKEKTMDLKEATFEDLKRENPTLLKDISEAVRKDLAESEEMKKKDAELKEAQEKLHQAELKEKAAVRTGKIATWLKECKLPEIAKERVSKAMANVSAEDDAKLREAFDGIVKDELEYLSKVSPKGRINLSESEKTDKTDSVKESCTAELERRMGIKKEEKKEE